jgi:hypothetical protein
MQMSDPNPMTMSSLLCGALCSDFAANFSKASTLIDIHKDALNAIDFVVKNRKSAMQRAAVTAGYRRNVAVATSEPALA